MAKKESAAAPKREDIRRTAGSRVKLHRYYKTLIASQRNDEQRSISKAMWVGLLHSGKLTRIG